MEKLLFTPTEQRDRIVEIQNNIFEKGASNHTNHTMQSLAETATLKNRTFLEGMWENELKQYK